MRAASLSALLLLTCAHCGPANFVHAQIGTSADPNTGEGCFDADDQQLYFQQASPT